MTTTQTVDLNAPMSADEVRQARLALGFKTHDELAEALGLTAKYRRDTVRSWESGKVEITGPARLAIRLRMQERGLLN